MLRRSAQQSAQAVLRREDASLCVDDLLLDIHTGRLHLVDSSRIGLSVLPERTLSLQRFIPQTVRLREDLQFHVAQQQLEIILRDGGDKVRPRRVERGFSLT